MCARVAATLGACLRRPDQPGGGARGAAGAANDSAGAPKARGCKGRAPTRPLRGGGSGAAEKHQAFANAITSIPLQLQPPTHIKTHNPPEHATSPGNGDSIGSRTSAARTPAVFPSRLPRYAIPAPRYKIPLTPLGPPTMSPPGQSSAPASRAAGRFPGSPAGSHRRPGSASQTRWC